MATIRAVPAHQLQPVGQLLEIKYLPLEAVQRWERNPKLHDIPKLVNSLARNGFQYPPKFDSTLNGGQGGIVFGNGRIEALLYMKAAGQERPSGIGGEDNEWAVPVLFGNDLASQQVAEAFAIDHNNLVMAGGDFTSMYATQMWDEARYVTLLNDLGVDTLPVSVTAVELDVLNEVILQETSRPPRPDKGAKIRIGMYRFYVAREVYDAWETDFKAELGGEPTKEEITAELQRRLGLKPIDPLPQEEEATDDN